MKKLLLLPLLFACNKDLNYAELRIKSEVVDAKCASGQLSDGTYVTKCTLLKDDGKGTFTILAAQGGAFPFQNWAYKTGAQLKEEAQRAKVDAPAPTTPAPAPGAGSGAAAPTK